jgi:hypothetical protein
MRRVAVLLVVGSLVSGNGGPAWARDGAAPGHGGAACGPPEPVRLEIDGLPGANDHLDPAVVRRVLRASLARLRSCYEAGLRRDPALRGTMRLAFTVGTDGGVDDVVAVGVDAGVDACFAGSLAGLQFPRPGGGVTVRVAFTVALAVDDGARVFDTAAAACRGLPTGLLTAASAWVRAYEAGDAAAVGRLLAPTVKVRGEAMPRARVVEAIAAAGSVGAWLPTSEADWLIARVGRRYALRRGAAPAADRPGESSATVAEPAVTWRKVKRRWRVVEIAGAR